MSADLRRIDPDDAEELDGETTELLHRWAARRLDVPEDQIFRVLVEVTGGCGEGTCEFTTARAEVDLADGRVFLGPDQGFGLFIREIVGSLYNDNGDENRNWAAEMWDLFTEDGKRVAPKPEPKPEPIKAAPRPPMSPSIGGIRVEQSRDESGRLTDRRTYVYTRHGWVDLREVIAAYDENVR